MTDLKTFINPDQIKIINDGLKGEEKEYFKELKSNMENLIEAMPETYGQDGKGDNAIVYLHYFYPGSDWWITEKDIIHDQTQAFGFACLNGDVECAELGYISIPELLENGVELDFHFSPKTLGSIKAKLFN